MLGNATVHATLPAVDLERARRFYEGTLGLKVERTDPSPGLLFRAGGGTAIYVYQRGATKADHTVAAFHVDDVDAVVKELQGKGVVFDVVEIPGAGIKTVGGVATMGDMKASWFHDPEGNIIGVTSM